MNTKKIISSFALAALLVTTAFHGVSSAPNAPYIQDVNAVSPRQFTETIKNQIASEGLPLPKMDLLPDKESSPRSTFEDEKPIIIGEGPVHTDEMMEWYDARLNGGAYRSLPQVNVAVFKDASMIERISTAIHEVTHYLDQELFLRYNLIEEKFDKDRAVAEGTERRAPLCIEERIADVSAALYLLANVSDKELARDEINRHIMLRSYYPEVTHYSADVLRKAVEEFNKAPKAGLTVFETAKWATAIVGSEIDIIRHLDRVIASQEYIRFGRHNVLVNPYTQKLNEEAFAARSWYLAQSHGKNLKPDM